MKTSRAVSRVPPGLLVLGVVAGAVGIWIGVSLDRNSRQTPSMSEPAPVFSEKTLEIARQFSCPCGSCLDEDLTICECPSAQSAKRFIEEKVKKGYTPQQVVEMVKREYGHFKG
ncbi:MAG: cytochrome c-type biogenesis protein CcmH [Fidelibacterota bacterium]